MMGNTYTDLTHATAKETAFDSTGSSLTANNVNDAIVELNALVNGGVPPILQVNTYADLPAAVSVPQEFRYVLTATGSYLLFNKRLAGWYYSDGVSWTYAGDNSRLANTISFSPDGDLTSLDVQSAIVELRNDTDIKLSGKSATGHTHTLVNVTDVTISTANLNSLDDGVDSTLHYHATDRARANHTGTQLASTISDFNTAVDARIDAQQNAIEVFTATSETTTSATYVALTGITATPAAGTYLAIFRTTTQNSNNNRSMSFALFKNNNIVSNSATTVTNSSSSDRAAAVCTTVLLTLNGTDVIDTRWSTTGNTATAFEKSLILVRVA